MRRGWRALLGVLLAVQPTRAMGAPALPSPVVAPLQASAPAAPSAPPRDDGSNLAVYVMTMGQGDLVWERFGHNALGIRDARTGEDLVYNWGMFSFDQPGFIPRFLRGEMSYWMAPFDASLTLLAYQQMNRSVAVQELDLTNEQKVAIRDFVAWNAREENKFYRYDYYRDNCSTRVRDALDRVLGGAIARATAHDTTSMTYRDHSLRLMDGMFWTRTGIDLGLGRPTDRRITAWEAMFIPMELQRRLRSVQVPGADGSLHPLVKSEQQLFTASRPPERMVAGSDVPLFLVLGVVLGGLLALAAWRTKGTTLSVTISTVWGVTAGFLGMLLLLLWLVTEHVAAHANQNLLFTNPLWLGVAALMPFVHSGRGVRRAILLFVRACAVLTAGGGLLAVTSWGQPSGAIAAFAVPFNFAVYLVALRAVYLAQQRAAASA